MRAAISAIDADVIALQELDRHVVRSWFADQPQRCGAVHYAAARRLAVVGSDGIALRVRGGLDAVEELRWHKRVAVLARWEGVSLATTHLQSDADVARRQLDELLVRFAAWPRPRILLGDLNLTTDDVRGPLRDAGFTLVEGGPTEPAWAPHHRIDHVAVDGLSVAGQHTLALPVSDHRAVVVEVVA